jgi:phenylacetic acid degradation operon negative regulatory protein
MPPPKKSPLTTWIDQYLSENPPRAKSLVMTLFGDVVTPHGGKVWLGSLIELVAPFGMNDRLVRTSVFRLAEEGWLDSVREGRRSQYSLNGKSAARFERAYQRIYTPSHREWDGRWTLVLATSGTMTAEQRAALKKELLWQGYGIVAPSICAHPAADAEILEEILQRTEVKGSVFVCRASEAEPQPARPLSDLIGQCWELDAVIKDYEQYIEQFKVVPKLLQKPESIDPEQAFVIRTLAVHGFRRINLHDPQLPLELLPPEWPGKTAYELCHDIYQATYAGAEDYILGTLRKEDENAPQVAPYFFDRFGGLT